MSRRVKTDALSGWAESRIRRVQRADRDRLRARVRDWLVAPHIPSAGTIDDILLDFSIDRYAQYIAFGQRRYDDWLDRIGDYSITSERFE